MKKSFRLCAAELGKVFSRPIIYLFMLILIALVFINGMSFNPKQNNQKLVFLGNSVGQVYEQFIDSDHINYNSSNITHKELEETNLYIYGALNQTDKLYAFSNLVENCYIYYNKSSESVFQSTLISLSNNNASLNQAEQVFLELKTKVGNVLNYIKYDLSSNINFYLSEKNYNDLKFYFTGMYESIPSSFVGYTKTEYLAKHSMLITNFSFEETVYPITSNLKSYTINSEYFNQLLQTYYTEAKEKLELIANKIDEQYIEKNSSTDEQDITVISNLIAQYYSLGSMNSNILNGELLLNKSANYSDAYLQKCIGFENFIRTKLNEQVLKNKYLIENDMYDYEVLNNYNYNLNSGINTNCFDFAFSTTQFASIAIIIFVLFLVANIIANEQNTGTIKLLAMRPISRNKILIGKYLSCLIVGMFLFFITYISSLLYGIVLYGLPNVVNVLVCFNASKVFMINAFALSLIYLISLTINLCFFISISMFVSIITKSGIITIFSTTIVYLASIIMNNALMKSNWYMALAFPHLDFFKYFGNTDYGFLTMSLLPDSNFYVSFIYIATIIFILNCVSHVLFTKRDLA